MSKKDRIRELETELRILDNMVYVKEQSGSGAHARHNAKRLKIMRELESLSLKWKFKNMIKELKT